MSRKPRPGEYVCSCSAYKFPHRFGGGKCSGFWIVEETWNRNFGSGICKSCNSCSFDEEKAMMQCEVYEGQETVQECQAYQEFIERHQIKC